MAIRSALYALVTLTELCVSTAVHLTYGVWLSFMVLRMDFVALFTDNNKKRFRKVVPLMVSGLLPLGGDLVEMSSNSVQYEDMNTMKVVDDHGEAPIVMLHGIFGFGKGKFGRLSYWAGAELKDDRILVPDLGSLTSVRDRAVELFYYLKGGTVDYGATAVLNGHSRFGRTYPQGHYPLWDDTHPIHLVGHSTGVQVARYLQHLLAEKAFPGYLNTNEDWVLSITAISGALNGTTRVHIEGIREEDGHSLQAVCLLQVLRIAVLVYEWLDLGFLKRYYGFGFDHYNLSWRKVGVTGLIEGLLGWSGPFAHSNWILPDLSIHSALKFNATVKTYPNTFYFSYATTKTKRVFGKTIPSTLLGIHPLLLLRTFQICLWRFKNPPYEGYRDEDWLDNDGALNTKSQLFPCIPTPHPHQQLASDGRECQAIKTGIWYYQILEADHIMFILDRDRAGVEFDVLYDGIFQRCRKQMKQASRRIGSGT